MPTEKYTEQHETDSQNRIDTANELNQFKADLSKALFTITERLTQAEAKITLLDQERLVLEERIQTLEKTIKLIGDDLTTWIEDSELQVEEATNPEDYERDATIERAEARKEARD